MRTVPVAVLVGAVLTSGLMAGLFFAYAVSVMPGLAASGDGTLVEAMQRINVAILNGWFGLAFGGALVLTAVATLLHLSGDGRRVLPWLVASLGLYVTVLVVTFAANIPLNDALAAAGPPDAAADLAAVRERFEGAWVRWNVVRTLFSVGAFASLVVALAAR